jgi:hypothetical protein
MKAMKKAFCSMSFASFCIGWIYRLRPVRDPAAADLLLPKNSLRLTGPWVM